MRKLILSSLLACSLVFVSCEQSTNESASAAPTPESAEQLRDNNVALLKNLQALKGQIESRSAMRLAARSSASPVEFDTTSGMDVDFGMLKTQIRTSLQAQGVCQAWIDWIVDLFDLLEEMLSIDPMTSSEADAMAMEDKMMALFNKAFACLEPLFTDVSESEAPNPAILMARFQEFDKCMCGAGGGSIFGTSAALVYGYYGLPSTGTPYASPSSPGGDSYGAPGSPAGSGYGAPTLFPE
jgi:hypothetical protein